MRIKKLQLFTNQLLKEKEFYNETLGFELLADSRKAFRLKIGWSELSFIHSDKAHHYHYCFLIPSNKLQEALSWMEHSHEVIEIEKGRKTQGFESWNADSFYFYDASGNLAEFIVRHDLKNTSDSNFTISDVLCVNEIGLPSQNIKKLNQELNAISKTELWKGDLERFGTHGSDEGMFLMPHTLLKKNWFPTDMKIESAPLLVQTEHQGQSYEIKFKNEKVEGRLIDEL